MYISAHIKPSELFEASLWELVLNREFTGESISSRLTVVNRWCGKSKSYSTLAQNNPAPLHCELDLMPEGCAVGNNY